MKNILSLFVIFSLTWASCVDKEVTTLRSVNSYDELDNLRIGQYKTYKIDSAFYVEGVKDSVRHSILYYRDEVVDTFRDLDNNLSFEVHRKVKYNVNAPFVNLKSYYIAVNNREYVTMMDNVKLLNLSFPIFQDSRWNLVKYTSTDFVNVADLNALNYQWIVKCIALDTTFKLPNTDSTFYPNSLFIRQIYNGAGSTNEYTDSLDYAEAYARNVGLIYKKQKIIVKRNNPGARGFDVVYSLIDHN